MFTSSGWSAPKEQLQYLTSTVASKQVNLVTGRKVNARWQGRFSTSATGIDTAVMQGPTGDWRVLKRCFQYMLGKVVNRHRMVASYILVFNEHHQWPSHMTALCSFFSLLHGLLPLWSYTKFNCLCFLFIFIFLPSALHFRIGNFILNPLLLIIWVELSSIS